ncbi:MAG: hypothetical protein H6555_01080 [Lewinellaceae bacterium]|nr:hypothetical protein [Lewinellaceae bacterium]
MSELQERFLAKLEEKYGVWDRTTSSFGTTPFGLIANDLSISASQFTKLLSGTATEGMYVRSIDNVDRLIRYERTLQELEDYKVEKKDFQQRIRELSGRKSISKRKIVLFTLLAVLLGSAITYLFLRLNSPEGMLVQQIGVHPLSAFFDLEFDSDFDSPYLKEAEVQEYCPCSAFEGTWSLANEYKLPLPGNKQPGVYYLAKSADVRMKCSKSDTLSAGKGRVLFAYEYLINEIWVDLEKAPLSPKYFDKETKTYTEAFNKLTFANSPQFRKVATIHSFFINKIELYPDSIVRKGEPCGRFATDIDDALVSEFAIDLKHVLGNVLGNLTKTNCSPAPNPYCDPNDLHEGESVISFDCLYTIKAENLGIGGGYPYRKGFRLEKQNYSDNLTCTCGS